MKKYKEYKNSGIDWIGEIPKGWTVVPLKYYLSLKGRIGWNGLKSEEFQEKSYAYLVTGQDFNSDVVNWKKCYQINKERYDEDPFIQLENGDILVTKDGTIGKIAKVENLDKPACLNSGIFVLKQTKGVFEQKFLYWLLVSNQLKEFVGFNSTGSTIAHLYQNVFENMPLIVPSPSEQQAIACYLDYKISQIDESLSAINSQIDDLKAYRQSILSEVVTKGLNPDVKMKDSGIEWIGEIPEGWHCLKLKHIAQFMNGYAFNSDDFKDKGDIAVYRISNIKNNIVSMDNVKYVDDNEFLNPYRIQNGDLLIAMSGATVGKLGLVNNISGVINQRVGIIRSPYNNYIKFALAIEKFKDFISVNSLGSAQPNISSEGINNYYITFPPTSEQETIASYLDSMTAKIDSAITSLSSQRDDLNALKQSIISEAVTGKIDVREWKQSIEQ